MAKVITREANVVQEIPDGNTTVQTVSTQAQAEKSDTLSYLIYFFFGLVEILLVFRFALKMTGANPGSGFVRFVYSVTQVLILPFEGIFRRAAMTGAEVTAVFEPATLVALVVYAVIAWGIVQLITILAGKPVAEA